MARFFDGSGDRATLASNADWNPTDVSVSMWIYVPSSAVNGFADRIIECGGFNKTGGWSFEVAAAADNISCLVWAGTSSQVGGATFNWTDGGWHHLFLTSRITGSNLHRFFANGIQIGTDNTSSRTVSTETITVASQNDSPGSNDGEFRMAELAIWDTNLPDSAAQTLHRGSNAWRLFPTHLVGYWKMLGSRSPEPDYTVNDNDMTLVGNSIAAPHLNVYGIQKLASVPIITPVADLDFVFHQTAFRFRADDSPL